MQRLKASLVLAALTALVFLPLLRNQFIMFDDRVYVTANQHVLSGITREGLSWALTTTDGATWHPLTWLSHMLDVELFGEWAGGHHLMSLVLHLANVLLLFSLLLGLSGALWRSAAVAALFAVHPLHVESVAWVAERKDLLSTFFGLAAALQYVAFVRARQAARYVLAVALFALALAAKPMLVTLPAVLLLLDWWPLHRFARRGTGEGPARTAAALVVEKAPLFLLALVSGLVTLEIQSKAGALLLGETLRGHERAGNALLSYAWYLVRTLYPADLSIFYPFSRASISVGAVAVALVPLVSASALVARGAGRRPYLVTGWLWFLGMLLPVIGLIQVGSQARADRYTYLPLVGVFLIAVWVIGEAERRTSRLRNLAVAGLVLALAAFAAAAGMQVRHWRTTETLMRHALEIDPHNWLAQNMLGGHLLQQGRPEEAIAAFRSALADYPTYLDARQNLALALARQGRGDEALGHLAEILSTYPAVEDAASRLSSLEHKLGMLLSEQGRSWQAIRLLEDVVRLQPDVAEVRYDLGKALERAGEPVRAIEEYREALRLRPDFPEAHNNLGAALAERGDLDEATEHFRAALRLDPADALALENLRRALAERAR